MADEGLQISAADSAVASASLSESAPVSVASSASKRKRITDHFAAVPSDHASHPDDMNVDASSYVGDGATQEDVDCAESSETGSAAIWSEKEDSKVRERLREESRALPTQDDLKEAVVGQVWTKDEERLIRYVESQLPKGRTQRNVRAHKLYNLTARKLCFLYPGKYKLYVRNEDSIKEKLRGPRKRAKKS
jgi:hypothetical protein